MSKNIFTSQQSLYRISCISFHSLTNNFRNFMCTRHIYSETLLQKFKPLMCPCFIKIRGILFNVQPNKRLVEFGMRAFLHAIKFWFFSEDNVRNYLKCMHAGNPPQILISHDIPSWQHNSHTFTVFSLIANHRTTVPLRAHINMHNISTHTNKKCYVRTLCTK